MASWSGGFMVFLLIGLAYALCILAKNEEGLVRTVGYTLSASLVILCMLYLATDIQTGSVSLLNGKSHMNIVKHELEAMRRHR